MRGIEKGEGGRKEKITKEDGIARVMKMKRTYIYVYEWKVMSIKVSINAGKKSRERRFKTS